MRAAKLPGLQFAVFRPQNLHLLDFLHLGLVDKRQDSLAEGVFRLTVFSSARRLASGWEPSLRQVLECLRVLAIGQAKECEAALQAEAMLVREYGWADVRSFGLPVEGHVEHALGHHAGDVIAELQHHIAGNHVSRIFLPSEARNFLNGVRISTGYTSSATAAG